MNVHNKCCFIYKKKKKQNKQMAGTFSYKTRKRKNIKKNKK